MQPTNQKRRAPKERQLIGAIDQGTSSTRFLVFESGSGRMLASSQKEIKRIVPKEGWVEMDPKAIMDSVYETIDSVHQQLSSPSAVRRGLNNSLKCIGICNQRESAVVWDSQTGEPLYNVIVWMDNRTKDIVDQMIDAAPGRDFNWLKDKTGLPMSTYFSAFKLKWLMNNVASVRQALHDKRLMFGTVDSWILWNLTGRHLTDVTNASRTFLMDIETLEWDSSLCKLFNVPMAILPQILASADDFGLVQRGPLKGLPITGVIGDQSGALFGHNCLQLGQTKATFGTGCFIMQNIGPGPLHGALRGVQREAKRGLVTTVGYKLRDRPASYALEGSIKIAGAALTWLRDNMQLISNYEECDQLVNTTSNSAGVFFVPALGGLYSPYWDPNAAGLYIGLSQFSKREHLVRSTFDSIAFQTNDILSLMRGVTSGLMIDGGLCKSDNMCQILADITGCDIVRPSMCETSALGAAMIAGHGAGIWSYDSMLDNSRIHAHLSTETHHYPHESLHYEDKFSSLIHQGSFPANSAPCGRTAAASASANPKNGFASGYHNELHNGDCLDSEAEELSSCAASDADDDNDDDNESQVTELPNVFHGGGGNGGGGGGSSSRSQQVYSPSLSTGYYSNEHLDKLASTHSTADYDVERRTRDSPVALSALNDKIERSLSPQSDNRLSEHLTVDATQIIVPPQANLRLERSYTRPPVHESAGAEFEDDDLYEDQLDEENSASSSPNGQQREEQAPKSSLDCSSKQLARRVHVFQSYISVEHRGELVVSWRLAVERSMKWTKVQHEEIRKIDYLRLSSIPISMYLFLSVGMVALSGLMIRT